jgi:Arc/MetJ-type ribon-helix-helix transcriptional regulator
MKTIVVKLPESLHMRLVSSVRRRGISRSALVREAVAAHLEDAATDPASLLGQAHDLAGCLSGPMDLSTNEKRLKGYGR